MGLIISPLSLVRVCNVDAFSSEFVIQFPPFFDIAYVLCKFAFSTNEDETVCSFSSN